jgi:NAD(P)H dehydrogenase (quinone)
MCVTTGGTPQRFTPQGAYGEIEKVLWPMQRLTLEYLGLTVEEPFICYGTPRVDEAARKAYLASWTERLTALLAQPIAPREAKRAMPEAPQAAWSRPG